jgi:hypothetical protein
MNAKSFDEDMPRNPPVEPDAAPAPPESRR